MSNYSVKCLSCGYASPRQELAWRPCPAALRGGPCGQLLRPVYPDGRVEMEPPKVTCGRCDRVIEVPARPTVVKIEIGDQTHGPWDCCGDCAALLLMTLTVWGSNS